MKNNLLFLSFIILAVALGCGKKGPPTLAPPSKPVTVFEARAEFDGAEGVKISWKVEGDQRLLAGFNLSRGEEPISTSKCRSCGDFYRFLTEIDADATEKEKNTSFFFFDGSIQPTYRYYYRIRPRYVNGSTSDGATVSLDVP
jgi:hypothetical protein